MIHKIKQTQKLHNLLAEYPDFNKTIIKPELYKLLSNSDSGITLDEIFEALVRSACPKIEKAELKKTLSHCDFAYRAGNCWKFFEKYPNSKMRLSKTIEQGYDSDKDGQLMLF